MTGLYKHHNGYASDTRVKSIALAEQKRQPQDEGDKSSQTATESDTTTEVTTKKLT